MDIADVMQDCALFKSNGIHYIFSTSSSVGLLDLKLPVSLFMLLIYWCFMLEIETDHTSSFYLQTAIWHNVVSVFVTLSYVSDP